ncbi:MAG: polysaccharide biosynthesis tyrosine autokinase [Gemmatales bacterium]|nr:polysaccharide biosynthesis tyrosine autokinase [Gemmatales bacterium]MDW8386314.1 polysaccharide biosynthesis tyrosine autokinase [Gemmatales bacterium]
MTSPVLDNMPPQAEDSGPSQLQQLLALAWRRKGLITFGLAVGFVIGIIYYAQCSPVYESQAQLLVVKKRPDALPVSGLDTRYSTLSFTEDYLATHIVLMRSPLIVSRAVQRRNLANLPSFRGQSDPSAVIPQALKVTRDTKESGTSASNILYLSYQGAVPEDCAAVINAIVDSYREFLDETYRSMSNETVELITQAKNYLQKDLKDKEEAYRQFRERSPVLLKGKSGLGVGHERIASLENRQAAILVRKAELQAKLAALDEAVKSAKSPAALRALVADLMRRNNSGDGASTGGASRNPSRAVEEQLLPLLLQEQALLEDYGPDHPQVVSVRQRIAFTRKFLNDLVDVPAEAESPAAVEEKARLRDPVYRFRNLLVQELQELDAEEKQIAAALKTEQEQAKALLKLELEEESLRNDVVRTQQLYENVIKRLQEIDLGKEGGGFEARLISPPHPGAKVAPRAVPIFAGAVLVGLVLGAGLAYLAEFLDRSFRSPEEIRRRLHLPVIGHIPVLTPAVRPAVAGSRLDGSLVAFHRPRSLEAEAYRSVRTALYFSTRGERHKVIQITSASKGEGKSTLAANLAISIAQSGRRVILVDADLRRPRIHALFGMNNDRGLSDVVRGDVDWKEVVQPTACTDCFAIPSGPIPSNPAELLTMPRFQELINALRDEYDFVLVDSPPLLAVTDPCVVAPRVDGVLLVLRLSKQSRPWAERSREILLSLGANLLGVVVNGVGRKGASTYGYAQESYVYSSDYMPTQPDEEDIFEYFQGEESANGTGRDGDKAPTASEVNGSPGSNQPSPGSDGEATARSR